MVRTIGHENRMSPTEVDRDGDRSEMPVPARLRCPGRLHQVWANLCGFLGGSNAR